MDSGGGGGVVGGVFAETVNIFCGRDLITNFVSESFI